VGVLEAAGSGELPDSVLTEARRTELREEVRTDAGSAQIRHFPFWSGLGVGSRPRKLKRPEEVLGASG